jgi:hypothetical protein
MRQRQEVRAPGRTPATREVTDSPLYGVAMLKIAMELKKPGAGGLDEIVSGVLGKMGLSDSEFRNYLSRHGGKLRAIAERRRY